MNGDDGAWITYSIRFFATHMTAILESVQDVATKILWKVVLPFKLYQPRRFLARIRRLLSIIKYARFGFPLFRMNLKLLDQLFALRRTYMQAELADAERHKRIGRPSLILDDLRRLESLARVQTGLAKMNSQLFDHGNQIARYLQLHQRHGRYLQRLFRRIRRDIHRNTVDHYETIQNLTRELQQRTIQFSSSMFSSQHLLSPRSRFSIAWRLTVTNVLLLEILRLLVSYGMFGHVRVSITQIIRTSLVNCEHPERIRRRLAVVTQLVNGIQRHISNVMPIVAAPPLAVCVPSSTSAALLLQFGRLLEHSIDLVSFLDIFIWFYTGDLDESGVIVPKPFFTRMILPGTLVQVLDHPTLPELLPSLIQSSLQFAGTVGYGRAIRWAMALVPCFAMVTRPVTTYLFGHVDTTRGILSYAESLGMFTPIRSYYDNSEMDHSFSSQIGLSFDESSVRSLDEFRYPITDSSPFSTQVTQNVVTPSSNLLRRRRRPALFSDKADDAYHQHDYDDDSYRFSFSSRNLAESY